jgi:HSP20 family protein
MSAMAEPSDPPPAPSSEEELERLFGELSAQLRGGSGRAARAAADVYLTEEPPTLTIELDVAGLEPATLDVALEGDLLTIRGERRRPRGVRRLYQHAEIDWGPFARRLRISRPVDAANATAAYVRGILRIELPLTAKRPAGRVLVAVQIAG